MSYLNNGAGRVGDDGFQCLSGDGFWTFAAVEERLVEAMGLWRRSPGGGRWPFAADAPWHLMTRRTRVEAGEFKGRELQLRMQAEDAEEAKRWEGRERMGPLTRDEIARRDEASEWLGWVPARDRRLVILALGELAKGRGDGVRGDGGRGDGVRGQVAWSKLKPLLGVAFGADGLRKRYSRAIAGVAKQLNGGGASGSEG